MIAMFGIALLSAATTNMEDMGMARDRYSGCLLDFTLAQLDLKTSASAFEKAAKETCTSEREAMFSSIKKDEVEFGSTNAEATQYANEEVDGELYSCINRYGEHLESGTRPIKE